MPIVQLSDVLVDFEDLVTQLVDDFNKRGTLVNITPSAAGQAIIDYIASTGSYNQYAIQRALEETFIQLAQQPNSVLTCARMLGVHLTRSVPASVTAVLTNSNPSVALTIQPYTQFIINNNTYMFNRDVFTFSLNDNTAHTVTLYQGQVINENIVSYGGAFQRYYLGTAGINNISDTDIYCTIGTQQYNYTIDGIWNVPSGGATFYQNTAIDGTVEVLFGNGVVGVAPNISSVITFTYVITNGSSANSQQSNLPVTLSGNTVITGTTTSVMQNGADPLPASFYSIYGPALHAAQDRSVVPADFPAIAATYPGVIASLFLGQANTNPNDLRYTNLIQYTILANPAFTNTQHTAFLSFMQTKAVFGFNYLRYDPTAVNITVAVSIYCFIGANLTTEQNSAQQAITNLFTLKSNSLGYSIYLSDIDSTIKGNSDEVDYVVISSPSTSQILTQFQYPVLTSVTITPYYSARVSASNVT